MFKRKTPFFQKGDCRLFYIRIQAVLVQVYM